MQPKIAQKQTYSNEVLKNNCKMIVFSFLSIFLIFRINLSFLPYYTELLAILGVVLILKNNLLSKQLLGIVITICALICFAVLVILLNGSSDFSYAKFLASIIYKIGISASIYFFYRFVFKEKATLINFFKIFILMCLMYLLSTFILLSVESLNTFWVGSIVSRNSLLDEGYFFRISISGYSGFDEVTVFAISLFMCAYIIALRINNNKKYTLYFIIYGILSFGCFLYGRISLVTIGLATISLFFMIKTKTKALLFYFKIFVLAITIFLGLAILSDYKPDVKVWFDWAFELLFSFFDKDKTVGSLQSLASMYRFPTSMSTFLIGDGHYAGLDGFGGYYKGIDVGFLRAWYFYGIIGMLANYILLLYCFNYCSHLFKNNKVLKYLLMFMFINVLLIELKGVMWDGAFTYLTIIMLIGINENKCKSKAGENGKEI